MDLNRQQLQQLIELVPEACILVSVDGLIVYANARAHTLFGYQNGELDAAPVEHLIPQHARKNDAYYRARFKDNPGARDAGDGTRIFVLHKDGHEIPVHIGMNPVGSGADMLVLCTLHDMSTRFEQEDLLRETAEKLATKARMSDEQSRRANEHVMMFLKHAPAAIAMLDRNMRYLIVSNRWLSDFGLKDKDVHGLYHYELFPDASERWKEIHRRCLAGEVLQSDEDTVSDAEGRRQWLYWEVHPWKWKDGRIGGVLWFSEVITRRKTAEAELLQINQELEERIAERTAELRAMKDAADNANAQKSWFVAAASHDLRQPLQASQAYLNVLLPKLKDPEQSQLCVKARQPLHAMADILDVLLDLAELESGQVQPHTEDFELQGLLEGIVANVQVQAQQKGLRLSAAPTDLRVHTDRKLLERVLSNFVNNAVRYTEKGLVGLYCEQNSDTVRVSVTDTGIGIPAHALEMIFEDHVQLGNTARDRRKGLGLGLAIAKRIADTLGHTISVQSEVGSGSSFSIDLPQALAPASPPVPQAPAPSEAAPAKRPRPVVLLIDDDPEVSEAMQMLLQAYGYETYRASGRDAALAMLDSGLVPGLVVCDYRLPGVNGIEVIRQVRKALNSEVPSVLLTGDTALTAIPDDIARCALLHKPVDPDRFFTVVDALGA